MVTKKGFDEESPPPPKSGLKNHRPPQTRSDEEAPPPPKRGEARTFSKTIRVSEYYTALYSIYLLFGITLLILLCVFRNSKFPHTFALVYNSDSPTRKKRLTTQVGTLYPPTIFFDFQLHILRRPDLIQPQKTLPSTFFLLEHGCATQIPRVKRALRLSSSRRPADSDYAPFFADVVWRNRVLKGKKSRGASFPAVLSLVVAKYGVESQKKW